MTRWQLLLALFLLALPATRWSAQHEAPWQRGAAAVYRMLSETGTVSFDNFDDADARRRTTPFVAAELSSYPPASRLALASFVVLARHNPMAGMQRDDRDQMDRNLWTYISTHASERQVKHLDRQWGSEGKCRPRPVAKDVAHVESCRLCRSVYTVVTRNTQLHCGSKKIGYQPPFPKNEDIGSTIPP